MMDKRWKTWAATVTTLLVLSGVALAQTASCPAIVRSALDVASDACAGIGRNQVCYGNIQLEGEPKDGVQAFTLDAPGDIVDAANLQALHLSALDADDDTWGIALMSLQGNIPATLPGQNVTFLLFGDVEITDPATETSEDQPPLQAFYFRSGLNDAPCPEAPDSGVLIQTPAGVQKVEFTINEVKISLGSTIYVQASGDMTLSVVEGEVEVEADGVSVTVPVGYQTTVPLDDNGNADGEPTEPEAFDPGTLAVLPVTLLPLPVVVGAEATPEATDDASGAGIIPAAGSWTWTSGAVTGGNCPEGVAEGIGANLGPKAPLTLPGDAFDLDIFFLTAFGVDSTALPNPVLSKTDANTYIADFSDPSGYNGYYHVTVLSESEISGEVFIDTGAECTITMPFTVSLAGA